MNDLIIREVPGRLNIGCREVSAVLDLLAEGATVPVIARYRKDATGALDEVQIQQIRDEAQSIQEFLDRKEFIEKTIREQDKMTEELQKQLDADGKSTRLNSSHVATSCAVYCFKKKTNS